MTPIREKQSSAPRGQDEGSIADAAAEAARLLQSVRDAKQKPLISVERQLGGCAWVQPALRGISKKRSFACASSHPHAFVQATVSWRPRPASS
jgi:hypothetical protein